MVESSCITPTDIAHFEHDGYITLPLERHGLVPDIHALQQWLDEVYRWPKVKARWRLYETTSLQGERQLLGTERVVDDHAGLKSILCTDGPANLLRHLTGKDVLLFKDEIDWKLPGRGGAIPHVDLPAYGHKAPEFIEIMIAVDPHTSENGCLRFVPGSHKQNVSFAENGAIDGDWASTQTFVPIHLNPGDLVIFGERMCHCLDPNMTDSPRRALFGTYHYDLSRPDLREEFFAHRLVHSPPANA